MKQRRGLPMPDNESHSFELLFSEMAMDPETAAIGEITFSSEAINELHEASIALEENSFHSGLAGVSDLPTLFSSDAYGVNYELTSMYKSS